ncbi:DNA/RNA polymerase [Piedraia hortae CBS 480.64]|uniref:DNA-directed RNA polymerase n=1 Tax=Piedraia hortae CBS 480.64 TaxID=1314780 RepID=A0A6A7C1F3_9PEZI|nr:DNA/RNA polymerase [Piedraia hortae CBS 480.64]
MLAGRRRQLRLAASLAQPWLALAQLRHIRSLPTIRRHLATTTDQPVHGGSADEYVPWGAAIVPDESPVVLPTLLHSPDANSTKVQHGVLGSTSDLLQHLYTSLNIGRLARAEAIIRRLAENVPVQSPHLRHAHTVYLDERLGCSLEAADVQRKGEILREMKSWFEMEVCQKGVQPDARMLVVMTRATIDALEGESRDGEIRRYVEWAHSLGEDVGEEVLYSEEYDDDELLVVGQAMDMFPAEEEAGEAIEAAPEVVEKAPSVDMLPELISTEQKGSGLQGIKYTMQPLTDVPPLPPDASEEAKHQRALMLQKQLEERSLEMAIDRWRRADEELREMGISSALESKPVAALMWQWHQTLVPILKKEVAEVTKLLNKPDQKTDDDRYHYGPYLELFTPDTLAAHTIMNVTAMIVNGKTRDMNHYDLEVKLIQLTTGLVKHLEEECQMLTAKKKQPKGAKAGRLKLAKRRTDRAEPDLINWPIEAKVKLGALLIGKLIEAAQLPVTREHPRTKENVTQMQPAFLHRVKYVSGRKVGVVAPNPALVDKLLSEPTGSLLAKRMPMLVKPKPWTGWTSGGYLFHPSTIMRLTPPDEGNRDYFRAAAQRGDLQQVYNGLNALSEVPWRVHPGVLKTQIEAWNTGEEIANFPALNPHFEIPPEPSDDPSTGSRRRWLAALKEIKDRRTGLHSKRCFQNYQLEVARSYANETLYFPHNMDFRGRAYPIPPYLNHMGADNVRGLLVFANGKPLGENGLRWLKIHTATVAGKDKISLSERVQFTEDHLEDIYDSAHNPLGGRRWWLQAEDAWQTLAACFELTAAMESPDPTKFISTLPIQQDGTCNGLQHYAALGGDEVGARQVNLEPGDKPADVYTAVAEAVTESIHNDALAGDPLAKELDGHVTRKCVKQPVMTNVYGVTFFGAREQVDRQLEEIFPTKPPTHRRVLAHYITKKIFSSLGTMFRGAQDIQFWLGRCAGRIVTSLTPEQITELTQPAKHPSSPTPEVKKRGRRPTSPPKETSLVTAEDIRNRHQAIAASRFLFKSTVIWTTPLRLPVVQPYRQPQYQYIKTGLQTIRLQNPQIHNPVSKRKQLQGFPPNFIHSLDATHMFLSAISCREKGLTFAAIHDSFWTHACDVDELGGTLRAAFVNMHAEDVVGRLREEMEVRYAGCVYLCPVMPESEAGRKINALRKGRKGGHELKMEVERLELLRSDNPEERDRGEKMITPGAIVEKYGEGGVEMEELGVVEGQKLGKVPEGVDRDVAGREVIEGEEEEEREEDAEAGAAAQENVKVVKGKKTGKSATHLLYVWRPLTFPEVPRKGSFNVRRLIGSQYFFH